MTETESNQNMDQNNTPVPQLPVRLSDMDQMNVELMKSKRREMLANAKAALAEQEKVELQYQVMVQNLFNKYGLTPQDKIDENGNIIRGSVNG